MLKSLNNSKSFIRPLFKKSGGFTLIESAVAIAVLMVGLWAVAQFFPFSLKVIGDSQNITVASNLVVAKMEEISSLEYDLINTGTIETKAPISSDPSSYLNNYQREVVVELLDSNFNTTGVDVGLKKITVTVFWISPIGNVEKSTDSTTVVADL